jgi:hypothetical protein
VIAMVEVLTLIVEATVLLGVWVNTVINLILYRKRKKDAKV